MTDIVKRLRDHAEAGDEPLLPYNVDEVLLREAADEIERLRAVDASELGRLRADNLRLVAIIARAETRYQAAADEIERLRGGLANREEQVTRLKRERMWKP